MKAIKIFLLTIVLLIVASVIFLYSSLNDVVKKGIETVGSDILGVPVSVSKVEISLKEGSAQISGLQIGNPTGFKTDNAFSLGKIRLAIDTSYLTTDTIKINDLTIVDPKINYELAAGKNNIGVIKKNIEAKKSPSDKKSTGERRSSNKASKSFIVENISFSGGNVTTLIGSLEKNVNLPEINIQNIGNKNNPASAKQVANVIMAEITRNIIQNTDLGEIRDQIQGRRKEIKNKVKEGIGGALKGIMNKP